MEGCSLVFDKPTVIYGVIGGIYLASTRFPAGPNLFQIFFRTIGLACGIGFIGAFSSLFLMASMGHGSIRLSKDTIVGLVKIIAPICLVGGLTAGTIITIVSIAHTIF